MPAPLLPLLAALAPLASANADLFHMPSPQLGTTPPVTDADPVLNVKNRHFLMEVNFRGRYLSIPDSLLDIWFFNEGDSPGHPPRPQVRAWGTGLEFVIKDERANGIFYVEYLGNLMEGGYWDDVEEPPNYYDGDYLEPDRLGIGAMGANYAHEIRANEVVSLLFGGGLGVMLMTGQLRQWKPGADNQTLTDPTCGYEPGSVTPAYERYADGCSDDGAKRLPKVLPMVDLNMGVRFTFNDRANLRLEGGLHNMLYLGMATGIVF